MISKLRNCRSKYRRVHNNSIEDSEFMNLIIRFVRPITMAFPPKLKKSLTMFFTQTKIITPRN